MPHPKISRREMLRRGAVVGGTLLWATPVIQSISGTAFAGHGEGLGHYNSCCECTTNGPTGFQCGVDMFSKDACDDFCGGNDNVAFYGTGDFECQLGPDGLKHCVPV